VTLVIAPEVSAALRNGEPVVALETSIVAQGLPSPHNLRVALGCERAIREAGAIPATIAVLDGSARVGLSRAELEDMARCTDAVKVSARDLGWVIAQRRTGATTVAGTVRVAALAGIRFMATGGIGGVHRGHSEDVSADLFELSRSPVAVFCAGPKMILDIPSTLEHLESVGVPVFGYDTDELPGFYVRQTGCRIDARADRPGEVAQLLGATWETGTQGVVVGVPPVADLPGAEEAVAAAMASLGSRRGKEVTPYLLARVAELTGGSSLDFNVNLVIRNATIAAACAVAWAKPAGPVGVSGNQRTPSP
jgi:pseudouridine-5'-phosphate glycosidase